MKSLMQFFSLALLCLGLSNQALAQEQLSNPQTATTTLNATISQELGDLNPPSGGLVGPGLGFEIQAYPNPGNGNFTIALSGNRSHRILVTDLFGRSYFSGVSLNGQKSMQVNISNAPKGLYRVQVDELSLKYQKR